MLQFSSPLVRACIFLHCMNNRALHSAFSHHIKAEFNQKFQPTGKMVEVPDLKEFPGSGLGSLAELTG